MFTETLTREQIVLEKLLFGLRRSKGVAWETILEDLSAKEEEQFRSTVAWLQQKKLINEKDGRLVLTARGLMVENEILMKLSL